MLYHVTIRYGRANHPIADTEGLRAMSAHIDWMGSQTEYPGVQPVYVGWKDNRPAAAYGFFESPSRAELEAYLDRLPGGPEIVIASVTHLDEMQARARAMLARA